MSLPSVTMRYSIYPVIVIVTIKNSNSNNITRRSIDGSIARTSVDTATLLMYSYKVQIMTCTSGDDHRHCHDGGKSAMASAAVTVVRLPTQLRLLDSDGNNKEMIFLQMTTAKKKKKNR